MTAPDPYDGNVMVCGVGIWPALVYWAARETAAAAFRDEDDEDEPNGVPCNEHPGSRRHWTLWC